MNSNRPYQNGGNQFQNGGGMPYQQNNNSSGNPGVMGGSYPMNTQNGQPNPYQANNRQGSFPNQQAGRPANGMPPMQGARPMNSPANQPPRQGATVPNQPMRQPNANQSTVSRQPVPNQTSRAPIPSGARPANAQLGHTQSLQNINANVRQNIPMANQSAPNVPVPRPGVVNPNVRPTVNPNIRPTGPMPVNPTVPVNPNVRMNAVPPVQNVIMTPQAAQTIQQNSKKAQRARAAADSRKQGSPVGTILTVIIIMAIICGTGYYYYSTRIKGKDGNKQANKDGSVADASSDASQTGDPYADDVGTYEIVIYYKPTINAPNGVNLYYKTPTMNDWTEKPGVAMEQSSEYPDFPYKGTIKLDSKFDTASVCFNNGSDSWDNGGGVESYYTVPAGTYCMTDKTFYVVSATGMDFNYDASKLTVYYSGYSNPNIHYANEPGVWTDTPGVAMTATPTSNPISKMLPYTYDIAVGSAGKVAVCFNDGGTNWDSNNSKNYAFEAGAYIFINSFPTHFVDYSVLSGGAAPAADGTTTE